MSSFLIRTGDDSHRLGLKDNITGRDMAVWIASPNYTSALFDKPPTPQEVIVAGKYTSQGLEKNIDLKLPVTDVMKDAEAKILSKQTSK